MEAVRNQKEDLPYDSKDPLFKFGFGLSYPRR
jgi:beta-glucosidase